MLRMMGRRGFTLVELVFAMVITLIVCGSVYQLLLTTQRVGQAQAAHATLQSNVRAASIVVTNELRELQTLPGGAPGQNDVLSIAPADISYRAMRGTGFVCQAMGTSQLRIAQNSYSGLRDPQAGRDSVFIFVEGDPAIETDDSWVPLALTGVSKTSACPAGLGPSFTLTTSPNPALDILINGTPVRIFEIMQLKLYRSEGKSWLGARSVSAGEAIQPALGPLRDRDGLLLEYLDGAGVVTADATRVKSIRVTVRVIAESSVTGLSGSGELARPEEQLVSQVVLRNSIRP
jgi:prepilin-type N-terminal cleavage/methylation domain-containing protein